MDTTTTIIVISVVVAVVILLIYVYWPVNAEEEAPAQPETPETPEPEQTPEPSEPPPDQEEQKKETYKSRRAVAAQNNAKAMYAAFDDDQTIEMDIPKAAKYNNTHPKVMMAMPRSTTSHDV